jgi:hypothetical protein
MILVIKSTVHLAEGPADLRRHLNPGRRKLRLLQCVLSVLVPRRSVHHRSSALQKRPQVLVGFGSIYHCSPAFRAQSFRGDVETTGARCGLVGCFVQFTIVPRTIRLVHHRSSALQK